MILLHLMIVLYVINIEYSASVWLDVPKVNKSLNTNNCIDYKQILLFSI